MIAKRVKRRGNSKFRKLGSYILNPDKLPKKQSPAEETEWRRTAGYILDLSANSSRAEGVRITNCHNEEIDWAILEIELTQQRNKRATGSRTYHLVISFPPGEQPSPEQLIDIEDELCAAIGLEAHQRISAIHTDTDHLHVHVAINQIHPEKFTCIEPWYDQPKLMQACERLEIKHGLQRTNHGIAVAKSEHKNKKPAGAVAMEQHRSVQSLSSWIKGEVYPEIRKGFAEAKSWQDLHALLARYDLTIKRRGSGLILQTGRGVNQIKASDIDRKFSFKALTGRFGAFAPPDPGIKSQLRKKSYRRRKVHSGDEVERLWLEYQTVRQEAMDRQTEAREKRRRQFEHLKEWFEFCRENILTAGDLTGLGKKSEISKLELRYIREKNKLIKKLKNENNNDVPTWIGFLRNKSVDADKSAKLYLEKLEKKFLEALHTRFKGGDDYETTIQELSPKTIDENKGFIYSFRDGGKIEDRPESTSITKCSLYAVQFLIQKHILSDRKSPLELEDSSQTEKLIVQAAASDQADITFSDPSQESERQRLFGLCRDYPEFRAALRYAVEYQATHIDQQKDLTCSAWEASHAGNAMLERLITLRNGSRAMILRQDSQILVKPCSGDKAQQAENLKGQDVSISAEGEVTPRARKRSLWR